MLRERELRCLFVVLLFAACGACESRAPEGSVLREERGDTLVLDWLADPPVLRADTVQTLWRSPALENPSSMIRLHDRLVIADRTKVHVLRVTGELVLTVGRPGEGPGEFRSVSAVGTIDDTILAFDVRLQRLSYHTSNGTFLFTRRLQPIPTFGNWRRGGAPLRFFDGGFLYVAEENVHVTRPTRAALVWRAVGSDSSRVIRTWDDVEWQELGGMVIAHKELFPPRALAAVGRDGRYAHGTGLEYCVDVETVGSEKVTRVCRDWQRVPVTRQVRDPDIAGLAERYDFSRQQRAIFEALIGEQEISDLRPSYDDLMFDDSGRLWVRTVTPEGRDVHPQLAFLVPDLAPAYRYWDVFDADGRLLWTVRLPSRFDPRVTDDEIVYGFCELSSGEIVIAKAELQPAI
jgi:hypothetical protein